MLEYHCQPQQDLAAVESVQGAMDSHHEQPIPCDKATECFNSTQHGHAVNTRVFPNAQAINSTSSDVCKMQANPLVVPSASHLFDSGTSAECAILPQPHALCQSDATAVECHVRSNSCANAGSNDQKVAPQLDPTVRNDPLVIELSAGTARVTACLKQFRLKSSFGVDKDSSKACSTCLTADMTSPEGQSLVWEWIKSPRLAVLHAAPPCGTSSRARELDNGPLPLRSDTEPDGISGLTGVNRERVSSANCLYNFLSDIIEYALSRRVICIIENPRNSRYWCTSFFQRICRHFKFVACEACAFGSRRPKKTVFATSCQGFESLAKFCPGEKSSSVGPI